MSTEKSPFLRRRAAQLQRLRARHIRWREARAARREIFSRPTPISTHLKLVARIHRLVDIAALTISSLIGLKFIWHLYGGVVDGLVYSGLELVTRPLLAPFERFIPGIGLGHGHRLELGDLMAMLTYGLLSRVVHWLIHRLGYSGRPLRPYLRSGHGG